MATEASAMLQASPYKGLTHYGEEDARFFFGRDRDREIIGANLSARRLTLLYGESGVGKSSVLRAGVVHDLRERGKANHEQGLPLRFVPIVFSAWRDDPSAGLLDEVGRAVLDAVGGQPGELPGEVPLDQGLERWAEIAGGELLIVLDQFEEYFLYHGGDDRFAVELPKAVNRLEVRAHFLISIREDALAQLDRFKRRLPRLFESTLRISHLDLESAREAIERPIAEYNALVEGSGREIELEPALVDAVLQQVQAGRVALDEQQQVPSLANGGPPRIEAPYLQLVMTRVWSEEMQRGSSVLRLATLEELGGAGEIVRTHLDSALGSLPPSEQDTAAAALRFLVTGSGTKIAHTIPDLAEFTGRSEEELQPVLDDLSSPERRILRPVVRAPGDSGDSRYEIYHDVLAAAVRDWRRRHAQQELERRRDEAERRARRERRKARLAIAAAGGFLLLAAFAAVVSVWAIRQKHTAESERQLARSRALLATAGDQFGERLDRGILLSLEAYRTHPSPETRGGLVAAVERTDELARILGVTGIARQVSVDDRGRRLAAVGPDGVWVFDLRGAGTHGRRLGGAAESATFSPGGTVLAVGAENGSVLRWDLARRRRLPTLHLSRAGEGRQTVEALAFSGDGKRLAAVTDYGRIALWDTATGHRLAPPGRALRFVDAVGSAPGSIAVNSFGSTGELLTVLRFGPRGRLVARSRPQGAQAGADVGFSTDGSLVASVSHTGELSLWNLASGRVSRAQLKTDQHDATALALDRTGGRIAVGWLGGEIQVWRRSSTGLILEDKLRGHHEAVLDLAFTPDARELVSTGADGAKLLWTPSTSAFRRTIAGQEQLVTDTAFAPDGQQFATVSAITNTFRAWRLQGGVAHRLSIEIRPVLRPTAVAFAPRGQTLAVGGDDGALVVTRPGARPRVVARGESVTAVAVGPNLLAWSTRSGKVIVRDLARSRTVAALAVGSAPGDLALSSDGKLLAVASDSGTTLWDLAAGKRLARPVQGQRVNGVAFDPGARTVASGLDDGGVALWDIGRGRPLGASLGTGGDRTNGVAFSPDGGTIAAAGDHGISSPGDLFLWDASTQQPLGAPLSDPSGPVTKIAFGSAGRRLLTGAGVVNVWSDLLWSDVPGMQRELCSVAGRNLSPADWHAFIPWAQYRRTCGRLSAGA